MEMGINLVTKWFELSQLVLVMLLVQLFSSRMQLLSRVILVDGTFVFVLMVYRKLVAALCLALLAVLLRKVYYHSTLFFLFHYIRVIYDLFCKESDILFCKHQEKKFCCQVWFMVFLTVLSEQVNDVLFFTKLHLGFSCHDLLDWLTNIENFGQIFRFIILYSS